jgi:glycosyltransferase involved in cell wall biosynthesis
MYNPLVSIIIPTYNRGSLINETLNSVLAQTYINWECIIVDDGSTDNSRSVIENYCKKDSRIKFYQRPISKVKGASSCRNYGFYKSKGNLIQYLDSDDILDKDKLELQSKLYRSDNEFNLFTSKWGWFETADRLKENFKSHYVIYKNYKRSTDLLFDFGYYNTFFPPHVYLTPRNLINRVGGWNESLTNNDDAEFFTRIILNADKIHFAENAKVFYRTSNKDKLSEINTREKALSAIRSWELINSHVYMKTRKLFGVYVRNALFNLYKDIEKECPEILCEHHELFNQRQNYHSSFRKIKIKFRTILNLKY